MKRPFARAAGRFVDELISEGRYTFLREEAARRLGTSPAATYMSLYRLVKGGRLAMPRSGFYVIVDPQHRAAGILPPEWFIHDLMRDIGRPYYVGLLCAARLHGAAHQSPQEFQVVVPSPPPRPIRAGNVRIRFHGKGRFESSRTVDVKTPTGIMRASTPETTAWDLARRWSSAGGLDNAATVLSELAGTLRARELRDTALRHGDLVVTQRLGYLLESLGKKNLWAPLAPLVRKAPMRRLDPAAPAGARADRRWRLWVNARPEPEA